MSCPLCGAESVGKSTLSGMEVFKCQSSQGPGGMARSEICRQREPLYRALEQAVSLLAGNDFELIEGRPSDYPELAEYIKNKESNS